MLARLLALITSLIIGIFHPGYHQVLASEVSHKPVSVTPTVFLSPTSALSPQPSPKVYSIPSSAAPLIDCVGPDEKHLWITYKACIAFNSAWHHPILTLTPTGIAQKIGDHTYTMQFTPDFAMASAPEIFQALNAYRRKNGVNTLTWNLTLLSYALSRSDLYNTTGKLDEHAGFIDYVNNHNGFTNLGFNKLGENAALAGPLNGTHLIEYVYAGDPEHNANQLNTSWTDVGIGVHGNYTDIIFGGMKR